MTCPVYPEIQAMLLSVLSQHANSMVEPPASTVPSTCECLFSHVGHIEGLLVYFTPCLTRCVFCWKRCEYVLVAKNWFDKNTKICKLYRHHLFQTNHKCKPRQLCHGALTYPELTYKRSHSKKWCRVLSWRTVSVVHRQVYVASLFEPIWDAYQQWI